MTRPTDASIARAFWYQRDQFGPSAFTEKVLGQAAEFDAESPAGTDCKICGGGNVYCAA